MDIIADQTQTAHEKTASIVNISTYSLRTN